jgi:hypothetical protein
MFLCRTSDAQIGNVVNFPAVRIPKLHSRAVVEANRCRCRDGIPVWQPAIPCSPQESSLFEKQRFCCSTAVFCGSQAMRHGLWSRKRTYIPCKHPQNRDLGRDRLATDCLVHHAVCLSCVKFGLQRLAAENRVIAVGCSPTLLGCASLAVSARS